MNISSINLYNSLEELNVHEYESACLMQYVNICVDCPVNSISIKFCGFQNNGCRKHCIFEMGSFKHTISSIYRKIKNEPIT